MRLRGLALLVAAHTAVSFRAAGPSVCTARRRSWPPALLTDDAVLAGEQEVTRAFAAVNSAPSDADKADLLRQLRDAQDAVATIRADRERAQCAARVSACAGGDEAASLLEDLRSTGVAPNAACYHAALRACGGAVGEAQGEWAALLYDEMAAAQLHDSRAAGLALRACVIAGTWREAAQVLEATDAGAEPPPRAQLLEALRCTPHAAPLPAEAAALTSLHVQLGEKLAEHLPSLWDGQQLQLLLPCVPAPEALCTLLLGSLQQLAEAQRAAGPVRSVVGSALVLTLAPTMLRATAAAETETETETAGAGAEVEAAAEPEPEPAWPDPKDAARPALRVVARRTASLLAEIMAQAGEALQLDQLGVETLVEVAGSAAGGEGRLRLPQPVAEEWVRMRCTQLWLEEARVGALSAEEREAEARALAALEEAKRGEAAARQARRQQAWAARNANVMEGVEQDRLAERTTMGAALDQMLVGQLDEHGLGLDEALEAAEAETEAAAAATAAAAVAATRAGGSAGPPRKSRQPAAAASAPRVAAGGGGEDLSTCTVVQLKEKLREAGLPVSGRKAELIERLAGASQ